MNIIITFAAAGFVGFLFYKLRIPGAMMIGAVCGTVLLSLTLRCAALPYAAKFSCSGYRRRFYWLLGRKKRSASAQKCIPPGIGGFRFLFAAEFFCGTVAPADH